MSYLTNFNSTIRSLCNQYDNFSLQKSWKDFTFQHIVDKTRNFRSTCLVQEMDNDSLVVTCGVVDPIAAKVARFISRDFNSKTEIAQNFLYKGVVFVSQRVATLAMPLFLGFSLVQIGSSIFFHSFLILTSLNFDEFSPAIIRNMSTIPYLIADIFSQIIICPLALIDRSVYHIETVNHLIKGSNPSCTVFPIINGHKNELHTPQGVEHVRATTFNLEEDKNPFVCISKQTLDQEATQLSKHEINNIISWSSDTLTIDFQKIDKSVDDIFEYLQYHLVDRLTLSNFSALEGEKILKELKNKDLTPHHVLQKITTLQLVNPTFFADQIKDLWEIKSNLTQLHCMVVDTLQVKYRGNVPKLTWSETTKPDIRPDLKTQCMYVYLQRESLDKEAVIWENVSYHINQLKQELKQHIASFDSDLGTFTHEFFIRKNKDRFPFGWFIQTFDLYEDMQTLQAIIPHLNKMKGRDERNLLSTVQKILGNLDRFSIKGCPELEAATLRLLRKLTIRCIDLSGTFCIFKEELSPTDWSAWCEYLGYEVSSYNELAVTNMEKLRLEEKKELFKFLRPGVLAHFSEGPAQKSKQSMEPEPELDSNFEELDQDVLKYYQESCEKPHIFWEWLKKMDQNIDNYSRYVEDFKTQADYSERLKSLVGEDPKFWMKKNYYVITKDTSKDEFIKKLKNEGFNVEIEAVSEKQNRVLCYRQDGVLDFKFEMHTRKSFPNKLIIKAVQGSRPLTMFGVQKTLKKLLDSNVKEIIFDPDKAHKFLKELAIRLFEGSLNWPSDADNRSMRFVFEQLFLDLDDCRARNQANIPPVLQQDP